MIRLKGKVKKGSGKGKDDREEGKNRGRAGRGIGMDILKSCRYDEMKDTGWR